MPNKLTKVGSLLGFYRLYVQTVNKINCDIQEKMKELNIVDENCKNILTKK